MKTDAEKKTVRHDISRLGPNISRLLLQDSEPQLSVGPT